MNKELKIKIRNISNRSKVLSELYELASELKDKINARMSDEEYLKIMFKKKTGKELNLHDPKGFNEKLQWLKLYNRKPEYTIMVDKVLAKEYVSQIIGSEHIIPTLGVWSDADEIDIDNLPQQFVLKCNHNSGSGMYICTDKSKMNIKQIRRSLNKGLKSDSFYASREWPYKNVPRRILAEQYMVDQNSKSLIDYKFYCFNGNPRFLYIALANYTNGKKNDVLSYINLDWTPAPFFRTDHNPFPYSLNKPDKFDEMITIAAKLSEGIPFVRVDLYYINGQVYFSEYTFSPGGGFNEFKPYEWEREIGSWIDLSQVKDDALP